MEQERTLSGFRVAAQLSALSGGKFGGEREGEVAEHLDVLVLERGEALEVFVGDLVAGGSEVCDRVVEVLGVPEHERVEREAERAELVFLPFPVRLTQLALVAVEDDPGDGVPALRGGSGRRLTAGGAPRCRSS
jgi:hypothetical protein